MDVSKLPLRKRFFKENAEFRASTDSVRSSAGMSDSSAAALASSATLLDQGASNQGKADVVMAEVDGGVTIAHDASASAPGPGAAFAALAAAAAADPAPHPRKARLQAFAGNPVKEEPAEALRSATPVNFATPSPAHAPHAAHQHQHQHHGHGHGHHAQEAVRHESASVKAETPKAASASAAVAPVAPASAAKPKPVLKRKASEDLLPVAAAPASAAVAAPPKAKEARAPKSSKKEAKKAAKVAGEPELYCFCRKPYDAAVFMIACDVCDEWYHGHCVGVREEEASNWKSYSCPDCRQESEDVEFEEDASGAIKSKKKKAGPVAKRCLNPTCAALAKSKSKYCSNACGVAVARENLRKKETGGKIEPSASAEQAPLAASAAASAATPAAHIDDLAALDTPEDLADRKLLDELKAKRTAAERSLTHVERTLPELDRAIAVAGGAPHTAEPMSPGPVVRSDNDGELSARPAPADDMVDCVSCGNPLPVKALARHLDQCFHPRGKPDVATVLAQAGIVRDASANSPTPAKPAPRSPTKRDKDLLLCGFPTEEPGGARCERLRKACAAHTGWEAQRKTELVQERARLAQLLADIARQESAVIAQIKRRHPAAGGRTIQH